MTDAANIIVPLIEIGLDRREISVPELDGITRYETEVFGLPALVQLRQPAEGKQWIDWCLNPIGSDVKFGDIFRSTAWPGDVWGIAMIDRRINFSVDADFPIHARRNMRTALRRFPQRNTDDLRLPLAWAA